MDATRILGALLAPLLVACGSDQSGSGPTDGGGTGGGATGGTLGSVAAGGAAGRTGSSGSGAGAPNAISGAPSAVGGGAPSSSGSGGAPGGGSAGATPGGGAGVSGKAGGANAGGGAGGVNAGGAGGVNAGGTGGRPAVNFEHVFVVAMENHDEVQIIGDTKDAPYINGTLVKNYASASKFTDVLDLGVPSEPHYVLMEAGTNVFADRTFTGDADPSQSNSTSSTDHLAAQMKNASHPVSFMAYQEGLDSSTGTCPIHTSGYYAPKHDPFVFFQDIVGSPPSDSNAYCAAHHKPMTSLAGDLRSDAVANYNFVSPNLCNDMHGASGCPNSNTIRSGDDWLNANLPAMIDYANAHRGVIFVVFDEGSSTLTMPFIAIGPGVKKGYVGAVTYTHRSLVKSVERIFGLPVLSKVAGDSEFADLFESGSFP